MKLQRCQGTASHQGTCASHQCGIAKVCLLRCFPLLWLYRLWPFRGVFVRPRSQPNQGDCVLQESKELHFQHQQLTTESELRRNVFEKCHLTHWQIFPEPLFCCLVYENYPEEESHCFNIHHSWMQPASGHSTVALIGGNKTHWKNKQENFQSPHNGFHLEGEEWAHLLCPLRFMFLLHCSLDGNTSIKGRDVHSLVFGAKATKTHTSVFSFLL